MNYWWAVGLYCLFGMFSFHQQKHAQTFRGENQRYRLALSVSGFLAVLSGIGILIAYGWNVSCLGAAGMFGMSLLFTGVLIPITLERVVPPEAIGLLGFIGWPICAFFLMQAAFP